MRSRFPWRDTSEDMANQTPSQWETPTGAQDKADKAEEEAKQYTDTHITSVTAHPSDNITYSGDVKSAENVKEAIDTVNARLVNIIIDGGNSNLEIVDARGGYPVLGERLDNTDVQIDSIATQVAENTTLIKSVDTKVEGILTDVSLLQSSVGDAEGQLSGISIPYELNLNMDTFLDLRNWYPTDDQGVQNKPWLISNNQLKINTANSQNCLWNNDRIQDGRLSLIWENPIISNDNLTYAALTFRASSFKDYYAVYFYAGNYGSNSNKVILAKVTNGSIVTLKEVNLNVNGSILKDNAPTNLEVEFYGSHVNVFVNGKNVLSYVGANDSNIGMYGLQIAPTSFAGNDATILTNFESEKRDYSALNLKVKDILATGDSIMAGQMASTADKAWITLFGNKIKTLLPKSIINNIAVNGANTSDTLAALIAELTINPYKYQAILISTGTNNARYDAGKRTTYAQAQSDITQMIKFIKNGNAVPILCIPPNFTSDVGNLYPTTYDSTSYSYFQKLVKMIKNVGINEGVIVVDNYYVLNNSSANWADGVHPNDAGYALMADNLYSTLYK